MAGGRSTRVACTDKEARDPEESHPARLRVSASIPMLAGSSLTRGRVVLRALVPDCDEHAIGQIGKSRGIGRSVNPHRGSPSPKSLTKPHGGAWGLSKTIWSIIPKLGMIAPISAPEMALRQWNRQQQVRPLQAQNSALPLAPLARSEPQHQSSPPSANKGHKEFRRRPAPLQCGPAARSACLG